MPDVTLSTNMDEFLRGVNPTTTGIAAADAAVASAAAADATSKANAAQSAAEATASADATTKANAAQAAAEATASADATTKANAAQAAAEAASVPYSGATADVDLGSQGLTTSYLICDYFQDTGSQQWADAQYRYLTDFSGSTSIEFGYRYLVDTSYTQSLDWEYRYLADSTGYSSIDWGYRQLWDSSSNLSADWSTRELYNASGLTNFSWNFTGGVGPTNNNALIFDSNSVGSLPSGSLGSTMVVTDATSPSVGSTVSGGGSDNCLVTHNGSDWIVIATL